MRCHNPTLARLIERFTLACCIGLTLSGCISSPKAIRQESRTMLDIYRNAIDPEATVQARDKSQEKTQEAAPESAQNNDRPALALENTVVVNNAKLATDRDAKIRKVRIRDAKLFDASTVNDRTVDNSTRDDGQDQPPLHTAFTRDAKNEIKQLFPRLPNPDILIYVYPHLATAEQVPIPGYTTALPLYERVHYAMPGDFIPARRSEQYALPVHQSVRP